MTGTNNDYPIILERPIDTTDHHIEFEDYICGHQHELDSCYTACTPPSLEQASVKKSSFFIKILPLVISVLVLFGSVVVWAASIEGNVKEWATIQDRAFMERVEKNIENRYVERHEFSRIDESLKNQKDDLEDIKRQQREMHRKIDKIYDRFINEQ